VYHLRRPQSLSEAWEMARIAVCLGPVICCLKIYDLYWTSKTRRPPYLHGLARRATGAAPLDSALPLAPRRKRTLTGPLPSLESMHGMSDSIRRARQKTADQSMSPFLGKLPFELRQIIYEEVLAGGDDGRVVHIIRKHKRLGHWRCRIQDGLKLCETQSLRCISGWLAYKARVWTADKAGRLELRTDDGLLPLLRTCRAIYSEAIKILYSKNIFHFYDPGDIRYFARAILPQRLGTIQSIIMDWEERFSIFNPENMDPLQDDAEWYAWRDTWRIISSMQGLKEVRVRLKSHKFIVTKARRMKMCQPLLEVRGLQVFELILPPDDRREWDFVMDAPFTIVRCSDTPDKLADAMMN